MLTAVAAAAVLASGGRNHSEAAVVELVQRMKRALSGLNLFCATEMKINPCMVLEI
jgi:hypothetical protein